MQHSAETLPELPPEIVRHALLQLSDEHGLLLRRKEKPAAQRPAWARATASWWRGNHSPKLEPSHKRCVNTLLVCAGVSRTFRVLASDAELWRQLCRDRFGDSLPPVRDFRLFYLKRVHAAERPSSPLPVQKSWCEGLHLVLEIVTTKGTIDKSVLLTDCCDGLGLPCKVDVQADLDALDLSANDSCSWGASYLWRESDEKLCMLSYPREQAKKLVAQDTFKTEYGTRPACPLCTSNEVTMAEIRDYAPTSAVGVAMSFELSHARNYVALSADDSASGGVHRKWHLETGMGEYSTRAMLRSRLALDIEWEWHTPKPWTYAVVEFSFEILSAEDDGIMEAIMMGADSDDSDCWHTMKEDEMEHVIRVLEWK